MADSEPKIAALLNSSDRSPNVNQGQDFGWRVAPEVVVEMRRILLDKRMVRDIAVELDKAVGEITEVDILYWISSQTDVDDAPVAQEGYYEDSYRTEIKRREKSAAKNSKKQADPEDEEDLDLDFDDGLEPEIELESIKNSK